MTPTLGGANLEFSRAWVLKLGKKILSRITSQYHQKFHHYRGVFIAVMFDSTRKDEKEGPRFIILILQNVRVVLIALLDAKDVTIQYVNAR